MPVEVLFNRPTKPIPLYRLHADMAAARDRLVLASAWFTDRQIAQTFVESGAHTKLAILSKSDLARDRNGGAVKIIRDSNVPLVILGTNDWREGTMHHKFVVADDVVWLGSYNFTSQAQKNYENIIRVTDRDCADQYFTEAHQIGKLAVQPAPVPTPVHRPLSHEEARELAARAFASPNGPVRCSECESWIQRRNAISWGTGGTFVCEPCSQKVIEPTDNRCDYCHQWFPEDQMHWIGTGGSGQCKGCVPPTTCCACGLDILIGGVDMGDSFGSMLCDRCHAALR